MQITRMEDKTASTQLKDLIVEHFTLDEIRELCFDLGIQYDDLPNPQGTLTGATIALIKTLDHQKRLDELIEFCRQKYPHVNWPDTPTKLYFEDDWQTEVQLQAALDEYKKYLRGKWEKDLLLDGPLDDFYIWLEGQGPEEKKLKEASSSPETNKDSLPKPSSDDSEASKQDQDKKEPQYVSYHPPPIGLQEALEKHERLIVLGTAGTGKSTFLRHLVYQKTTNDSNTIPILVNLSDYAKALENSQPS